MNLNSRLGSIAGGQTFDQVTRLDHMRVGMINGHIKAERLQQHVLVKDEVLRLFLVRLFGRLLAVQAHVCYPDHVLQLAGLLLHLKWMRQKWSGVI